MFKKNLIKLSLTFMLVLTTLIISIAGYLSSTGQSNSTLTVGEVEVEVDVYFVYDNQEYRADLYHEAESYNEGTFTKFGVYKVNLSSETDIQFIKNLRVDVKVKSKVDTYLRIAPYEQLTLTYQSGGKTTEVATVQDDPMPFNYMDTGDVNNPYFYNNRNNDGFFYYTDIVKRQPDTSDTVLSFIADFGSTEFVTYEERYSLQLGFIIEAVQAIKGPENNWGLPSKPWDDGAW